MFRLFIIPLLGFSFIGLAPMVGAQSADNSALPSTPRERVIAFLFPDQIVTEDQSTSEATEVEAIEIKDSEIRPGADDVKVDETSVDDVTVKAIDADLGPEIASTETVLPDIIPDPPASSKPVKIKSAQAQDFSFYVRPADYVKARTTKLHSQLKLTYQITKTYVKSGVDADPAEITLTVGPDYVAMDQDGVLKLYDFKTHRVLSVVPTDSGPVYGNLSLYAQAYERIHTVNLQTQKGTRETIDIGNGKSVTAFWFEADQGWAARDISDQIRTEPGDRSFSAVFEGEPVFTLSLDGEAFPDTDTRESLLAFWHFELPVHPAILSGLSRLPSAPTEITTVTKTPKLPNGIHTKWTLVDSQTETATFPLPHGRNHVMATTEFWPVGFVIEQAVDGTALDGRPGDDDLRQRIFDQIQAEKWLEAWILAQLLSERQDGCENDPSLLCEDIAMLEGKAKPNTEFKAILDAREARGRSARLKAFNALLPYMENTEGRAFTSRMAGTLRSRLKASDFSDPKVMSAAMLLESALIRNPYDPVVWRLLAQVYAAQGRFDESWHVQDALRHLNGVPEKLTAPIKRVETALPQQAPGFFVQ